MKKETEKVDDTEDNYAHVVIATTNPEKAIYIIAKEAMNNDELEIHYTEKYAPTVEYLLRMIRKAFGWMETGRQEKEVVNTKCFYNHKGVCTNKERQDMEDGIRIRCTESVRMGCGLYKKKFEVKIKVNCVFIEKVGQMRNM